MDFVVDIVFAWLPNTLFSIFWPILPLQAIYLSFHTTRARTRYLYLAGFRTRKQHYTI